MSEVLVFDVNETLLDLGALDPLFDDVLGDAALRSVWFATMLQVAFVGGLTGDYVDFTTAQKAALHMVAARARRTIDDDDVETIVAAMRRLPPHPDARPALERLHDAGYRLTALTNSVLDVAEDQLVHAGLADLFEGVYSADTVRALNPSPGRTGWSPSAAGSRSPSCGWSRPTPGTSRGLSRRARGPRSSLGPARCPLRTGSDRTSSATSPPSRTNSSPTRPPHDDTRSTPSGGNGQHHVRAPSATRTPLTAVPTVAEFTASASSSCPRWSPTSLRP